ncbi:MAG: hypothetical protein FJX61_06975 [Alphaproteobacteria bacterium]|nr:hypothetical protein [Alphaproteobacteria bacterium]
MKVFDTLDFARRLKDAGVPGVQAEAHAQVIAEMVLTDVATKADLDQVKRELLQAVDARFASADARFAAFEHKVDARFAAVDQKIERLRDQLTLRLGALIVVGISALAALQRLG